MHNVEVSGPLSAHVSQVKRCWVVLIQVTSDSTVIPSSVKAHVSLRVVPDQALEEIASSIQEHLEAKFKHMRSPNRLKVSKEEACGEVPRLRRYDDVL